MNRILSCPVPTNINPLSPNGFMFSIERIPEVEYFCQTVNLPEISLPTAIVNTPFVDYPLPGEKIDFGQLDLEFLVDSKFANYTALFNWLRGLGFPQDWGQYASEIAQDKMPIRSQPALSDATLTILSNNNVAAKTITFTDCYPMRLGSIEFTSNTQDVQYIVGRATLGYAYYTLV